MDSHLANSCDQIVDPVGVRSLFGIPHAFSRLAGVLTSPHETFKAIDRKPSWITPVVISILIAIAGNAFFYWRVNPDWEQRIRASIDRYTETTGQTMSPDQVAQQVASAKMFGDFFIWLPAVFIPLFCVAIAGFYWLAFGMAFLRAPSFKKILSVVGWSQAAIKAVGMPIILIVLMAVDKERLNSLEMGNSTLVQSNLGVLLPNGISPGLRSLAVSLDLFTIWFLVLLTIGFSGVGLGSQRITPVKIASLVFGMWLVWVLLKAGLAFVFGY